MVEVFFKQKKDGFIVDYEVYCVKCDELIDTFSEHIPFGSFYIIINEHICKEVK